MAASRGIRGWAASLVLCGAIVALCGPRIPLRAQDDKSGSIEFAGDTSTDRDAGVWIDGKYRGYVKELKGDKKVSLPPGEHDVSVREAGYQNFEQKVNVQTGETQLVTVSLTPANNVIYPGNNAAELRLDVKPKQAAVYVDNQYMGHGSDFGGHFHSMLLIPGMHHIRIQMQGYQTYQMDVTVSPNEKAQFKADLTPCAAGSTCT